MHQPIKYERYNRQVILPGIGEEGQRKLLSAKVLVIGAGGLGCPILQYLVAAGVGTIGIADDDVVTISNLQRQVLYTIDDIGKSKAHVAMQKLKRLNDDVQIDVISSRITNANAFDLIANYDIVVDGSDNFATRYMVNDACVLQNKPLIYGSVFRFEGQVAVLNVNGSANYRDLFPVAPLEGEVPNCNEAGVLGVLPAIIGSLMANEVIKLILNIGTSLVNLLLTYNSLSNTFYEIAFERNANADKQIPKERTSFEAYNYHVTCNVDDTIAEVDAEDLLLLVEQSTIIDVREKGEQPIINEFNHINIPLSKLKHSPLTFDDHSIIVFCQSGKRSREAAVLIRAANPTLKIYSLKGGILEWKKRQQ